MAICRGVELPYLPGETVQYLMGSRYCQSDLFQPFVNGEFADLDGGQRVMAMCDWIAQRFAYVPGISTAETMALETFVWREGDCAARMANVYALGVDPPARFPCGG